jgi:hypothetical protein
MKMLTNDILVLDNEMDFQCRFYIGIIGTSSDEERMSMSLATVIKIVRIT